MAETTVIYEVTLEIDPAIIEEFDRWLATHIQAMLRLPGFREARMLPAAEQTPQAVSERLTRVVQYTVNSQAELDAYLRDQALRMRAEGIERFGDRFHAGRRILKAAEVSSVAAPSDLHCLNCGTPLAGKYCVECGQPNHNYVAPLWETIEEFFGSHFGFDTKFFHSIVPLLIRPGFLTREYCVGRRERYIKPLRLYLFSSILFFFCAGMFLPSPQLDLHPQNTTARTAAERADDRKQLTDAMNQIKNAQGMSDIQKTAVIAALQGRLDATNGDKTGTAVSIPDTKSKSGGDADINLGKSPFAQKLTAKIRKIKEDPQGFDNELLYHAVPKLMFVFLPLVALLLKLFYIRRKHLYMEHLIFTLHCHALFFMALLAGVLVISLTTHYGWPAEIKDWTGTFIKWYLVIYLFLALRNFYQQSWLKTLVKFCLLFIGYFGLAIFGLLGALAVAFMEV